MSCPAKQVSSIQLTDRDLAVLYYTWQNRLLALRHYRRKFWPEASLPAAAQRLYKLRDAGFLKQATLPLLNERTLFCATRLGNVELAGVGLIPDRHIMDFPRRPAELTPTMRHDLQCVDLRIAFEETGADAATWQTDHQLRLGRPGVGHNTRTPDGIFRFQAGQRLGHGVLEFELASYRRPKLEIVLRRLKSFYGDHTIFFVCRTAQRAATLRSWCQDARTWQDRPSQICIVDFQNAVKSGLQANFIDLQGT